MTVLNKTTVTKLNNDVIAALQAVAKKHGVQLVAKGGKFDANGFRPRISFAAITEEGVMTKERTALASFKAQMAGFKSTDFGRKFTDCGRTFVIEGFRTRAPRRPLLVRDVTDNKQYTYTAVTTTGTKVADLLEAA